MTMSAWRKELDRQGAENFLGLRIERENRVRAVVLKRFKALNDIMSKAKAVYNRSEKKGTVQTKTLKKHYRALMRAEAPT